MKKIVILGSTGSIGRQTLEVIRKNPGDFKVIAISGHKNTKLLHAQMKEFKARTGDPCKLAVLKEADLIVNAISGCAGVKPTWKAVCGGKNIALANKESLVSAGEMIMAKAQKTGAKIIPIDSEHSAIFQILEQNPGRKIKKIILTCSGGPFHGRKNLHGITKKEVLRHPVWKMGPKITVDCATLMNKGLEIIEAKYLFGLPVKKIKAVIHMEGIVHGMVRFTDGETLVHISKPDMKILIKYALYYPKKCKTSAKIVNIKKLYYEFGAIDTKTFPLFKLATEVAKKGGKAEAHMNKVNEKTVKKFLNGKIKFHEIHEIVISEMQKHFKMR